MARVIRLILFLLLVVGIEATTNNIFAEANSGEETCIVISSTQLCPKSSIDSVRLPYFPEAELGSIGANVYQTSSSRVQRTQLGNSPFSLKAIARILAEREAMLFKHWGKVEDTAFLTSITHPVSEYYVFALRHILI